MPEIIPPLNTAEVRVLGALIEKALTTPDYYPLSLAALTQACNQLSNREPVVSFDESDVTNALYSLREKRLATLYHGADSRVAKYKHALNEVFLLTPAEVALLCVLMLRGPQTLGELRARTERLYKFTALADVAETLQMLSRQPQPLVVSLPRQFGMKEARYTHLFSGSTEPSVDESPLPPLPESIELEPIVVQEAEAPPLAAEESPEIDRLTQLEAEVASLRYELEQLRQQLGV